MHKSHASTHIVVTYTMCSVVFSLVVVYSLRQHRAARKRNPHCTTQPPRRFYEMSWVRWKVVVSVAAPSAERVAGAGSGHRRIALRLPSL